MRQSLPDSDLQPRTPVLDTRPTGEDGRVRAGLRFSVLMAGLENGMFSFVFLSFMNTYLLDVLKEGPATPGYTLAAYSAVVLVMNTVAGALLDRVRPAVILGMVVSAQLSAVAVLLSTSNFEGFLVATILLAFGTGSVWPLVFKVLGNTQPLGRRANAGAAIAVAGYTTTALGLLLGVSLGAVAHPFVSLAVIAAMALAPLYWIRDPILTARVSHTPRKPSDVEADPVAAAPPVERPRGFRQVAALLFLGYGARTAVAGVYGPFAQITLGHSLLATAPYLVPAGVFALISLWSVPRWSRPRRRPFELSLVFALAAVGSVLAAMAQTPLAAGVASIPLVIGMTACAPLLAATVLDVGTGENSGLIFGSLLTIEGIGTVAMRALAAFAIDLDGPRAGFAAIAGMFVALALLSPTLPKPEEGEA